jgi:hypothetical protein
LVFITQQTSFTQDCNCLLKIPDLSIQEKNKMLSDFNRLNLLKKEKYAESPIHLGIDYGFYSLTVEHLPCCNRTEVIFEVRHTVIGYFDFNLYSKKLFGKIEIGGTVDKEGHYGAGLISLGFNYNIFQINRSHLYTYLGLKLLIAGGGSVGGGGVGFGFYWVINPKYTFSITKFLSVSVSLRCFKSIGYTQYFVIPAVGVQFFL